MNRRLKATATFIYHKAGQGLFYSGTIRVSPPRGPRFDFVYDCGSENGKIIEKTVSNYKSVFLHDNNNHIDMLVISHLHKDHVSGLDKLLNDNTRVDYVFLPYLLPAERLILALMYQNMPAWYYQFIADPVAYLLEHNVGTVVLFVGEGGEGEGGIPPENIPPEPPKGKNEKKLDIKLEEIPKPDRFVDEEDGRAYISYGDRLLIKTHHGYVIALGLWIFRFFNYKLPVASLSRFKQCVKSILNGISIKDAIIDETLRNKLSNCYKQIRGKRYVNNTSLLLYHTPLGRYHAKKFWYSDKCFCSFCPYYRWACIEYLRHRNRFGQFLTGDIDLNHDYNQIRNHYRNYLHHTFAVQVPHHGARNDWNSRLIDDVPDLSIWIVSAGSSNRYGHPRPSVIYDILQRGHALYWANELQEVSIKGDIEWQ